MAKNVLTKIFIYHIYYLRNKSHQCVMQNYISDKYRIVRQCLIPDVNIIRQLLGDIAATLIVHLIVRLSYQLEIANKINSAILYGIEKVNRKRLLSPRLSLSLSFFLLDFSLASIYLKFATVARTRKIYPTRSFFFRKEGNRVLMSREHGVPQSDERPCASKNTLVQKPSGYCPAALRIFSPSSLSLPPSHWIVLNI